LHEPNRGIIEHDDFDAAFMHKPVMEATEAYKVAELCFAAIRPVFDVVAVDEFLVVIGQLSCIRECRVGTAARESERSLSRESNASRAPTLFALGCRLDQREQSRVNHDLVR
ncbi:MAG TPA: hypothetical protein VFS24_16955, partial [Steroidobacteraceae bacterium]|nr:hypothetical protein [Steroidobacteraceae bacterium]